MAAVATQTDRREENREKRTFIAVLQLFPAMCI